MKVSANLFKVFVAVVLVVVVAASTGFTTQEDDAIVRVNGSLIMGQDFDVLMQRYIDHYKHSYGVDLESQEMGMQLAQLEEMVLQQLIVNELVLQLAQEMGIEVTEEEVEEEIKEIMAVYPDEETFEMVLLEMGYTEESFRQDFRVQIITERFMEELVETDGITEEEIEEHFQQNQGLFGGEEEQIHASHILLETEEEAIEVQGSLEEKSFHDLAATYSQCPSGDTGGDLGFFTWGQMVPAFEEAAFGLNEGEISEPVETDFGWHLIKVHEYKEAVVYTFEEVQEDVYKHFLEEKKQRVASEHLEKAIDEADIEYFDREL